MAKVELKKPIVEEISAVIQDAQSVVLVDHRGLTVEQDTRLRRQLREEGITYKVYKNTMMNFAFKGTDCEALVREVTGLGLKEAKDLVDNAPKMVKEAASKEEAEDVKAKLEAEGAKVTLK